MKGSDLTKKQKQMVLGTAVLAVLQLLLAAYIFGWIRPAAARGGSAGKELAELEQEIATARAVIAQRESIFAELEAGIAKLEVLAVYAPASPDRYAWAYEYISRCAAQARVPLDSLEEVLDSEESAEGAHYRIRVSTYCSYEGLIELLRRLENDNPLLRVNEVTIASVEGTPQSHRVIVLLQWPAAVQIERGIE